MTQFNADHYLATQDPANLLNLVPGSVEYSIVVNMLQGANAQGRIDQFREDRENNHG
jgi:hypothetical protein